MMSGKAYYQAVRAHKLTYEALWNIRWPMFISWVQSNGEEIDPDLQDLVNAISNIFIEKERHNREEICHAVDNLWFACSKKKICKKYGRYEEP